MRTLPQNKAAVPINLNLKMNVLPSLSVSESCYILMLFGKQSVIFFDDWKNGD